jgi:hypothetical protein
MRKSPSQSTALAQSGDNPHIAAMLDTARFILDEDRGLAGDTYAPAYAPKSVESFADPALLDSYSRTVADVVDAVSPSATPRSCGAARLPSPSAIRWGSMPRSPPASSPRSAARSPPRTAG